MLGVAIVEEFDVVHLLWHSDSECRLEQARLPGHDIGSIRRRVGGGRHSER